MASVRSEEIDQNIISFVKKNPGSSISDVSNRIGTSHPTVRRRVGQLCHKGILGHVRHGKKLLLYAPNQVSKEATILIPLLEDRRKRQILESLAETDMERTTINKIAENVGVEFGFAKRVLSSLHDIGALRLEREDFRYVVKEFSGVRDALKKREKYRPKPKKARRVRKKARKQ